jgi:protoporphyrinogen oxidase
MPPREQGPVVVVGGGFCGLAAAYELSVAGRQVTVLECDAGVGGLAGSFEVGGERLERFYHHWFTSDRHIMQLIAELGAADHIVRRPSTTSTFVGNRFYRLASPLDLLRFTPLPFRDRLRLGLMTLRVRHIADWQDLEHRTAAEWLGTLGGERSYRTLWEPLLRAKFGEAAEEVAAVWMWNKLKLRGSSRDRSGREQLAYYRGGFAALADHLAAAIVERGGRVETSRPATGLAVAGGGLVGVRTTTGTIPAVAAILTPALPIIADLLEPHVPASEVRRMRSIRYLANVCTVLELDRSLSDTYWLNVNDPGFPFVAVIEHTNFEPASTYAGRHVVYLSRYLPVSDPVWHLEEDDIVADALKHLGRMFPAFEPRWILDSHVWRARYAQPIVDRGYRCRLPGADTAIAGVHLATMAQIYPEDRGTNYAVREGRRRARQLLDPTAAQPSHQPGVVG